MTQAQNKIQTQNLRSTQNSADTVICYNKQKTKVWINTDSEMAKVFLDIWTNKPLKGVTVTTVNNTSFMDIKKKTAIAIVQ